MRSASPSRACGTSSCPRGPCGKGSSGRRRRGRSAPRASRAGRSPPARAASAWLTSGGPSVGRLHGVEPGLRAVDVLAGAGELVAVDPSLRAAAAHLGDAVGAREDQVAVSDEELVAVERADRRARGAVPLLVVGPAVAGTD